MTSRCSPGMGETSGNAENRYAGISDVALTPRRDLFIAEDLGDAAVVGR